MPSHRSAVLAALTLGLLAAGGPTQAQSLDDKLRAQLRSVLDQLHALQNSQATLAADKASAEQERDALKAKLAAGGGARAPAAPPPAALADLQQQRAEVARLTEANKQAQTEIERFRTAYAQVVASLQQTQAERDHKVQEADAATQALAVCDTKNIELVKIGRDVLAAYTKIGVLDALAKGEPMIGLKRVKMEQIAQDYGDKVYAAKFDPRTVKPAAPAAPQPASPAATQTGAAPAPAAAPKP